MHLRVEKLSPDSSTHASRQNSPPGSGPPKLKGNYSLNPPFRSGRKSILSFSRKGWLGGGGGGGPMWGTMSSYGAGIPIQESLGPKIDSSKIDLVFYSSEVDKMRTRGSWGPSG